MQTATASEADEVDPPLPQRPSSPAAAAAASSGCHVMPVQSSPATSATLSHASAYGSGDSPVMTGSDAHLANKSSSHSLDTASRFPVRAPASHAGDMAANIPFPPETLRVTGNSHLPPKALQVAKMKAQRLSVLLSRQSQASQSVQTPGQTAPQAFLQTPSIQRPSRFGPQLPQPGIVASGTPAAPAVRTPAVSTTDLLPSPVLPAATATTGMLVAAKSQEPGKEFRLELCQEPSMALCQELCQEPSCPVSGAEHPDNHCFLPIDTTLGTTPGTNPGTTPGKAFSPVHGKYIESHRQNRVTSPSHNHRSTARATPSRPRTHSQSPSRSKAPVLIARSHTQRLRCGDHSSPPSSTLLSSPAAYKHKQQHQHGQSSVTRASPCPALRLSVDKLKLRQPHRISAMLKSASPLVDSHRRSLGLDVSHGCSIAHGCDLPPFNDESRHSQEDSQAPPSAIGSEQKEDQHRHKRSKHSLPQSSEGLLHTAAKRLSPGIAGLLPILP